ncbi:hypothetical protein Y032_0005g2390 [Ancylostoma ceylanicum]|uniref:Transthyretin-like family protein n=1 Tax=Ancylostoma ceylanicum TaxID=53326 RepID=A0A016VRS6_9BILA|nr:hypothetical protein Y032_0005g2390 [Ancylostoma ceylanicum]
MAKLCFIALVASLLPVQCLGAPTCGTGGLEESETTGIVKIINDRRTALVDGTQSNGGGSQNLPPAKSMRAIVRCFLVESPFFENRKYFLFKLRAKSRMVPIPN